jgi:hypothetical protein
LGTIEVEKLRVSALISESEKSELSRGTTGTQLRMDSIADRRSAT